MTEEEQTGKKLAAAIKLPGRPLHIVSPAYVLTAVLFVLTVLAVIVGSFMVRVPVIVDGQGMLMADTDVVSYAITPEGEGRLESFFVAVGSPVRKGQVIAQVDLPRLKNEIETAKLGVVDLRHKESALVVFQKESLDAASVTIKQQRIEARSREIALLERMARLDKAREGDAELIKKGFMSARGSDAVNTERAQVEDQIFVSKRQMMEAETNFSELAQRQRREKLDISLQISSQQRQLEALSDRQRIEGVIISPYDGLISDLLVDAGQPISRERRVATVTPADSVSTGTNRVNSAVIFVPSVQGKKLAIGMQAQVLPLIFEDQQYGRIEGVVTEISTVTADEDVLLRVFKNQKLVRKMFEADSPYKVLIKVSTDDRGRSGLAWSSSRGPNKLMEPGTIVSGWVVYDQPRLLYLLLPAVKRLGESALINAIEFFKASTPPSKPSSGNNAADSMTPMAVTRQNMAPALSKSVTPDARSGAAVHQLAQHKSSAADTAVMHAKTVKFATSVGDCQIPGANNGA